MVNHTLVFCEVTDQHRTSNFKEQGKAMECLHQHCWLPQSDYSSFIGDLFLLRVFKIFSFDVLVCYSVYRCKVFCLNLVLCFLWRLLFIITFLNDASLLSLHFGDNLDVFFWDVFIWLLIFIRIMACLNLSLLFICPVCCVLFFLLPSFKYTSNPIKYEWSKYIYKDSKITLKERK